MPDRTPEQERARDRFLRASRNVRRAKRWDTQMRLLAEATDARRDELGLPSREQQERAVAVADEVGL